jgi:Uma2 family endonuclease
MRPGNRTPRRELPPLQSGDRLTGVEFERRATDARAELIDGVVYMGPPVSYEHGDHQALLLTWLGTYAVGTPGVRASAEPTLRLDEANRPEPDACLRILPEAGGRVRHDPDGILRGTVELVAEVAASTAAYDLHQKKDAYARQALPEYLVLVLHSRELHWFVHRDGAYVVTAPDSRGIIRSVTFPGLWLDAPALLRGDGPALLETLRVGMASQEHEDFSKLLRLRMERH